EEDKAIAFYKRSLDLFRAFGEIAGEANALNNLASVYSEIGEKRTAVRYAEEALPLWIAAGSRNGEAFPRNLLGTIYDVLGAKAAALEYYQQSLRLRREIREPRIWETLLNLGDLFLSTGDLQKALDSYHEALALTRESGLRYE